ncbi:class I SAM-dependent methyltransferase, partial [bacterium]|nr:class I SAM-dependent methyltransferase [bacterium]
GTTGGKHSIRQKSLFQKTIKMIEKQDPGPVWVDFGAGTGANLEHIDLNLFNEIHLVDLSPSLLKIAEERSKKWSDKKIHIHHQDATKFHLDKKVDLITFSYSLTMIPEWFLAIDSALQLLKPGGLIAVIDFFIPNDSQKKFSTMSAFLKNHFWPAWFSWDGVYLSKDHVPYLTNRFETLFFEEDHHQLPYLPKSEVPFYLFIGKKF